MDNKTQLNNVELALKRYEDGENKIFFYVGQSVKGNTSASILTTYKYALYLHNNGLDVIILHDKNDYIKPTWIGEEFKDLKHVSLESGKVTVSVVDILVYPETHPDVMEKTKGLNCTKVILCQSHKNILPSLPPGLDWTSFGIDFVIVVSEKLKDYVKGIFHIDDLFIKVIEPSVDDELFYDEGDLFRCPIVPVLARNQADILTLAKEFYLRYPEHKMVSFKDMRSFSVEDFAQTLNESFLGVWLDKDASFGQFPIEAYKCNLPIIALKTDMEVPYDLENITWVDSKLEIPELIFTQLVEYLNESNGVYPTIEDLYTVEKEERKVCQIFEILITKKQMELEKYKEQLNG